MLARLLDIDRDKVKIDDGKRLPNGANVTLVRLERTNVTLAPNNPLRAESDEGDCATNGRSLMIGISFVRGTLTKSIPIIAKGDPIRILPNHDDDQRSLVDLEESAVDAGIRIENGRKSAHDLENHGVHP